MNSPRNLAPLSIKTTPSPIIWSKKPVLDSPTNHNSIEFSNATARDAIAAANALLRASNSKKKQRQPFTTLSSFNSAVSTRQADLPGSSLTIKPRFALGKKPLVKKRPDFAVFTDQIDDVKFNNTNASEEIPRSSLTLSTSTFSTTNNSPALVESSTLSTSSLLTLRRCLRAWRITTDNAMINDAAFDIDELEEFNTSSLILEKIQTKKAVMQDVFSPPRKDLSHTSTSTPPPSYSSSVKKRRIVTAKRRTPNATVYDVQSGAGTGTGTGTGISSTMSTTSTSAMEQPVPFSSPSRFFEEDELAAQSAYPQFTDTSSTTNNNNNTMPASPSRFQPLPVPTTTTTTSTAAALIPHLHLKVNANQTKIVDPSPIKKRRITEMENKQAPISSPPPAPSVPKTIGFMPAFQFHNTINTNVNANTTNTTNTTNATNTTNTTHTTNEQKTHIHIDSKSKQRNSRRTTFTMNDNVPPLCATDAMYRTALEAFETSMSKHPDSHDTKRALTSVTEMLKDITVVLGDATIPCPELSAASMTSSTKEESKEEAVVRRLREQETNEILIRMKRSSQEREETLNKNESSMIRWKIGYTPKPMRDVVVVVVENEDAMEEEVEEEMVHANV